MRRTLAGLGLTLLCALPVAPARAQAPAQAELPLDAPEPAPPEPESEARAWSGASARTIRAGRVELGVFSSAKWGITDSVELALHPVTVFLLPEARAKVGWWHTTGAGPTWWLSTEHKLSVPTSFVNLVAKEGVGGLLPADSEVPFALALETLALASFDTGRHTFTGKLGFAFAATEIGKLPLLDFPFLYSLLAPLYSPLVGKAGLAVEGALAGDFDYQVQHGVSLWHLGAQHGLSWAYAQNTSAQVGYRIAEAHRVSLGAKVTVARYPIGWRLHWLPTIDYSVALF